MLLGPYTAKRPKEERYYEATRKMYFYIGLDVFLIVLHSLYKSHPRLDFLQHLNELLKDNKNKFQYKDKEKIQRLKSEIGVRNFDIGLLLKIIQATCPLAPNNEKVWTRDYSGDEDVIERILYRIKETRNSFSHQDPELLDADKKYFTDMKSHFLRDIKLLIEKSVGYPDEAWRRFAKLKEKVDKSWPKEESLTPMEIFDQDDSEELPESIDFVCEEKKVDVPCAPEVEVDTDEIMINLICD